MAFYDFFDDTLSRNQGAWIVSDLHLGEQDLKDAFPKRPDDETLIKQINCRVGKNDLLIVLGDVGSLDLIPQLRAQEKWLILGNHDLGTSNYLRQDWKKTFDKSKYPTEKDAIEAMKKLHPNCKCDIIKGCGFFSDSYWVAIADNRLFDRVFEGPVTIAEKLILSHEPIPSLTWARNLHGHSHTGPVEQDKYHYNCALEVNNYEPINFKQLIKTGLTSHITSLHRTTIDIATAKRHLIDNS